MRMWMWRSDRRVPLWEVPWPAWLRIALAIVSGFQKMSIGRTVGACCWIFVYIAQVGEIIFDSYKPHHLGTTTIEDNARHDFVYYQKVRLIDFPIAS